MLLYIEYMYSFVCSRGNDDNLVYCCLLEMLIGTNFVGNVYVAVMIFYLTKTIQC